MKILATAMSALGASVEYQDKNGETHTMKGRTIEEIKRRLLDLETSSETEKAETSDDFLLRVETIEEEKGEEE